MSGEEALKFLDGTKKKMQARDLVDEGERLFQAGDFAAAEQKCKEAIGINPQNAVAHSNIGAIYFRKSQFQEAIPWLEKALSLDPNIEGVTDCLRECRSHSSLSSRPPKRWWEFWK